MWTLVVNDLYLTSIFVQLLSYVDHSPAHSFGVTSLSPNSLSCVVSTAWDPRTSNGPIRANTIDFLRPTHNIITAQPAPNHFVDETQPHPTVTTLEAGAFFLSTTLVGANAWVYPHPSNFAEPAGPLSSSLRRMQYYPTCSLEPYRGSKFARAFLHSWIAVLI